MTKQLVARGKKFDWRLTDKGLFRAELNGEAYEHETFKGLRDLLDRQLKKTPINVPCLVLAGNHWDDSIETKDAVIVGKHSGNGNLLIKVGKDAVEQFRSHRSSGLLRANADVAKIHKLHAALRTAKKNYEDFIEASALDKTEIGL